MGTNQNPFEVLKPYNRKLSVANGNGLEVLGSRCIFFHIGPKKIFHSVFVVKGIVHEFVIGNDLLSRLKANVLYTKKCLRIGDKLIPLQPKTLNVDVSSIHLSDDLHVTPYKEVLCQAELSDLDRETEDFQ